MSIFLGLIVLFGWYAHLPTLIQIHPNFVAMQFNTALGFLACGLAGILIHFSRYSFSKLAAFFLIILGSLTLTEYILDADLRIDEMFMNHYILTKTSHPGRMAPNTALCFLFVGTYSLLSSIGNKQGTTLIRGILGSLVFALGIVALSGYLMNLETAYGWGSLTQMAVHTATGFIILGFGGIMIALKQSRTEAKTGEIGLPPVIIAIAVITVSVLLWQAGKASNDQVIHHKIELSAKHITNIFKICVIRTFAKLALKKRTIL